MSAYRECSRNLWNVYFSARKDVGAAQDVFERIRELLFDSLVLSELSYEGEAKGKDMPPPVSESNSQTKFFDSDSAIDGVGKCGVLGPREGHGRWSQRHHAGIC